jgi:DNA-binding CsgD family transcriptional regulator
MAVFGLTPREAEVALLVAQGLSQTEAAGRLGIAPGTARTHLANAMAKSGARSQNAFIGHIRGLPIHDERA